ncbi:MAG: EcsC family protein, partial [Syntrophales bacterium]
MNELDLKRLEEAVKLLENPGWIAKITNMIGMPIDWAIKKLPEGASSMITKATEKAITKALVVAVSTMDRKYRGKPFKWSHRFA